MNKSNFIYISDAGRIHSNAAVGGTAKYHYDISNTLIKKKYLQGINIAFMTKTGRVCALCEAVETSLRCLFCQVTLRAKKSTSYEIPSEPYPLGEHLRRARLVKGQHQGCVAELLGISTATLLHYEKNQTKSAVRYYPKIMEYLGYCPYRQNESFGEMLRYYRLHAGLNVKQLAREIGADERTVSAWEANRSTSAARHWKAFLRCLGWYPKSSK